MATTNVSRIRGFGVEYMSAVALTLVLYVDDMAVATVSLPAHPLRDWFHTSLDTFGGVDVVGKRLRWTIDAVASGLTELYNVEWWVTEMEGDMTLFDTGDVMLSAELVTAVHLTVFLFAHRPLTYTIIWHTDNVSQIVAEESTNAGPVFKQYFLRPAVGRAGRLVIRTTEPFSPIQASVGVIAFGDGAIKSVALRSTAA